MTRNFTKCAFSVTLNIEVERQGVEKAVFFADCTMFMDFKMKSTRKYCTIASKCRSPFSRKGLWEVVTIKIKTYKTKKATTRARTSLRRVRVRSLFLRAFAMAHGAYAWFARCVEAISRISRALAYRIDIVHGAANPGGTLANWCTVVPSRNWLY